MLEGGWGGAGGRRGVNKQRCCCCCFFCCSGRGGRRRSREREQASLQRRRRRSWAGFATRGRPCHKGSWAGIFLPGPGPGFSGQPGPALPQGELGRDFGWPETPANTTPHHLLVTREDEAVVLVWLGWMRRAWERGGEEGTPAATPPTQPSWPAGKHRTAPHRRSAT